MCFNYFSGLATLSPVHGGAFKEQAAIHFTGFRKGYFHYSSLPIERKK